MNKDDELIMYFIVNKDLNMSPGKIATQVAHTLTNYMNEIWIESGSRRNIEHRRKYLTWFDEHNQKKIILRAKQTILEKLKDKFWAIRDLGLTEIEKDSLTCVCLGIMTRKEAEPLVKRLQLL